MARPYSELRAKLTPVQQERSAKKAYEIRYAMRLYDLRRARKFSQEQIAESLHVNPAAVSKMERRSDVYLSTLRRYVEATGGTLRLIADFPDEHIEIDLFSSIGENASEEGDESDEV